MVLKEIRKKKRYNIMLELNLEYQIHSIDDILNDPDLDAMLEGLNED